MASGLSVLTAFLQQSNVEIAVKFRRRTLFDEVMLLIGENPAAPSLRTHGLKGAFAGCSASRLSREYRIVFVLAPDRVTFIDIGTHDDVYR
jgi:mRNA-degrading endonuclease YafQ of YafQ-DinJ toxin-antitoxin module